MSAEKIDSLEKSLQEKKIALTEQSEKKAQLEQSDKKLNEDLRIQANAIQDILNAVQKLIRSHSLPIPPYQRKDRQEDDSFITRQKEKLLALVAHNHPEHDHLIVLLEGIKKCVDSHKEIPQQEIEKLIVASQLNDSTPSFSWLMKQLGTKEQAYQFATKDSKKVEKIYGIFDFFTKRKAKEKQAFHDIITQKIKILTDLKALTRYQDMLTKDYEEIASLNEKQSKLPNIMSINSEINVLSTRIKDIELELAMALKAQQEAELKVQQEAELKVQQEAELKVQQEAELKVQQEAKLKAQQEAKLKVQQEAKLKAQQEAKLKMQQEAELKVQQEAELKAQQEAKLKMQQEAELKVQQEAELKVQQEAKLKMQQEAELKMQQEAELKAQQEAELKAQQEAELKMQQEAELKMQQEAKLKMQQEAELKVQQEAKLKVQQEAKLKMQQEAELKVQQEAELKMQQEAELKMQQEAKLKVQQEAELKVQQEAQLKMQQEAELKTQQETELNAQQETRASLVVELKRLLNNYKEARAEKYHVKDAFASTDKKARETFVTTMNALFDAYETSGTSNELLATMAEHRLKFPGIDLQSTLNKITIKLMDADPVHHSEEVIVLEAQHKDQQKLDALYNGLNKMVAFAKDLTDKKEQDIVSRLAGELRQDLDCFVKKEPSEAAYQHFKTKFKARLHSEDSIMSKHEHLWKPIVANLLIALFSLGTLIGIQVVQSKITSGCVRFFATETAKQKMINQVEELASTLSAPQGSN